MMYRSIEPHLTAATKFKIAGCKVVCCAIASFDSLKYQIGSDRYEIFFVMPHFFDTLQKTRHIGRAGPHVPHPYVECN